MSAPDPLLEQLATGDRELQPFWEQLAAERQALLAVLVATDDEPSPPGDQ